jgi:gamma-glutamyltranspeptidase / glutathione hydrolase
VPGVYDRPAGNARQSRSVVMARRGLVATSQPLASAAGLHVLRSGGNAIDAAVTAAAVLSVVEPTMTGVGGDLFALVWNPATRRVHGLNASGRSGYAASADVFASREIPPHGPLSISVPGAVDGWAELLEHHGTLTLAEALAAAIAYARDGFPVAEIVAAQWNDAAPRLLEDRAARETFLPGGRAPRAGQVFANPPLARTLTAIAEGGRDAFYRGDLARRITDDLRRRGALVDAADFADHRSDWVEPLRVTYRGVEVLEMPPNTQGFAALEMLNLVEADDVRALGHNSAACLHLLIEAKRIAFADRDAYLADVDAVPQGALDVLLSKEYAARRREAIDPSHAAQNVAPASLHAAPSDPRPPIGISTRDRGDTVYLTAADGEGRVVSLIQSLFDNFGSGVVAGDTGVVLHNRGSLFRRERGHPNVIAPHKRPFHTLIPGMVLRGGHPWISFGVMGGDLQAQGHLQVLTNLIDFEMNVQEAGDAARFRHSDAGIAVEDGIGAGVRAALERMGHRFVEARAVFGGYQAIMIDSDGVLMGGSDPRKDGLAVGY